MALLKADFIRFFGIGFALGAALVFTTLDNDVRDDIARGVVPAAEAAPAR